jgi:hypothetical protein
MKKRAQFFLLAAVIISVVVISLGVTLNKATVNREPKNFYDFSYEVRRETGAVMDYELYTNFSSDANLDSFVDLLSRDIIDKDSDANFLFVYGDKTGISIRNYGKESVGAGGEEVPGAGRRVQNFVTLYGSNLNVEVPFDNYSDKAGETKLSRQQLTDVDSITIDVGDQEVDFKVTEQKRVLFVIQKEIGNEKFVSAE